MIITKLTRKSYKHYSISQTKLINCWVLAWPSLKLYPPVLQSNNIASIPILEREFLHTSSKLSIFINRYYRSFSTFWLYLLFSSYLHARFVSFKLNWIINQLSVGVSRARSRPNPPSGPNTLLIKGYATASA